MSILQTQGIEGQAAGLLKKQAVLAVLEKSGASEDEVRALRARVEEINASLSSKLDAVMRALQTNGAQAKPKRGP